MPDPTPARPRPLADALSLLALVVVLVLLWPRTPVPAGLAGAHPPWWGGFLDLLLEGPDAGEWAVNAARVADGQARQVDHHRMPTWLLLVGGLHRAGVDLVLAGHVVNRLLYVLMGLSTWAAGRLCAGPGAALLAASLALGSPHLRLSAERYGIDVAVAAAVAAIAAAALAAARWPRLAPPCGALVGAALLVHYTTLPLLLPALLLALAAAPSGARARAALGISAGLALVGVGAALLLRLPTPAELVEAIWNGLPPSASHGARPQDLLAGVIEVAAPHLGRGLRDGAADLLHVARPAGTPWPLVVLAGALGLLGPGLAAALRGERDATGRALRVGLALASLGAGAPLLSAAGAPERYVGDLAPVGALLLARGVCGLALAAGARAGAGLAGVLEVALGAGLALLATVHLARPSPAPEDTAVGLWLLARAVQAAPPPDAPVAVAAREVAIAAGRPWCTWDLCSHEAPGGDPEGCMARVRQTCGDGGPLLWVSLPGWRLWGAQNDELVALDAWVGAQVEPIGEVTWGGFRAELRALP